jgi:hypothetical protein
MIFGQRWSGLSCIQVIETDHPVDPNGELAGVYKRVGAGGTVDRPAGRVESDGTRFRYRFRNRTTS